MISIVVSSCNTYLIYKCVSQIIKNTKRQDYEVCIHWNHPTHKLQFTDPRIFIYPDTFVNFAHANNTVIKTTTGSVCVLVNDDCWVEPSAIDNMVDLLESDESLGIVGAKLLFPTGKVQHIGMVIDQGLPVHLFHKEQPTEYSNHNRIFPFLTGALIAFRKTDFDVIGGFQERYKNAFDDVDYCLRMRTILKKKVVYCASAVAIHLEHSTVTNPLRKSMKGFLQQWKGQLEDDIHLYRDNPDFMIYGK